MTYEIKDLTSPVAQWLRTTFPHTKEVQAAFRIGAGAARVLPTKAVASGTQGAAIDWWLRMLVDPAVSLDLPLAGLQTGRAPCVRAGVELLVGLGALNSDRSTRPMQPARFAEQSDAGGRGSATPSPCWWSCTGPRRSNTPG